MYENLLALPYFQGMSKDDITAILDKVTFEFAKHKDGDPICLHGEKCDKFMILIQGEMSVIANAPDSSYTLTEQIHAPYAIEPYSMFGYNNHYIRDYIAMGECAILTINKRFLFSEFSKHSIFTINFLNLISHKTQKLNDEIWEHTPRSIKGRIAHFITMRSEHPNGRKSLAIKMERLASILCETRLNVSKSLNEMQDSGLIELHRKEIVIPSLKRLVDGVRDEATEKEGHKHKELLPASQE